MPQLVRQGLFRVSPEAHNAVVTITHLNGTVRKATVLSHAYDKIRAVAPGCDDILAFTRIHGAWVSEEIEPVAIEFDWQRRAPGPAASEHDCICPKELAAHLVQTLLAGCEPQPAGPDYFTSMVFSSFAVAEEGPTMNFTWSSSTSH